jgi:hypothetical protein
MGRRVHLQETFCLEQLFLVPQHDLEDLGLMADAAVVSCVRHFFGVSRS